MFARLCIAVLFLAIISVIVVKTAKVLEKICNKKEKKDKK